MSAPASARHRWIYPAALIVGSALAFLTHFRPWEVAFLEEWPLAEYWIDKGWIEYAHHYFAWSLSRPLHLVPTAIGLTLGGGAPGAIYLVLGIVAALQFLGVMWALRPLARSFWVTSAVAVAVALHPIWPGGYLQRFLPAQTAALALIIAIGFLIRWLLTGRIRWIVAAPAALVVGLLTYPGSAAAGPLAALAISLVVASTWRRRAAAVLTTIGASAIVTVYSLVITRLIAPDGGGYEAGNFVAGAMGGPRQTVQTIGSTLIGQGHIVIIGVVAVAALGAILALSGTIPDRAGWIITGTALVSPAASIVFFGNLAWLQDIERIAYATSLGLTAALLVWPLTSLGRRPRLEAVIAVVLVVLSLLGAARGIGRWQPYIALQHQLFAELAPVVHEAQGDEIVVVVDHSGTYGSEYTLPQYYISSASHLMNDDDTEVWLCYEAGDPPLGGAAECDPDDIGNSPRLVSSFTVPNGEVDLYISRRDG